MKKLIIIAILTLSTLLNANTYNDGMKAYKAGKFTQAKQLFEKAAKKGDVNAQYRLAYMYANAHKGIKKDSKKSIYWYEKAAKQNNANAQADLAWIYGNGIGVEPDIKKAKKLFKQACKNGSKIGCAFTKAFNKKK